MVAIGDGKEKENLKKLIHKYGVEDEFLLMGRKDNPYSYMKQCDLYVQPSRHEGYVITLVEARTLCLPIITSDIPSAHEQIIDGINGYIVPLDAKSFADKIEELYMNRNLLELTVNYLKKHKPNFDEELKKLDLR